VGRTRRSTIQVGGAGLLLCGILSAGGSLVTGGPASADTPPYSSNCTANVGGGSVPVQLTNVVTTGSLPAQVNSGLPFSLTNFGINVPVSASLPVPAGQTITGSVTEKLVVNGPSGGSVTATINLSPLVTTGAAGQVITGTASPVSLPAQFNAGPGSVGVSVELTTVSAQLNLSPGISGVTQVPLACPAANVNVASTTVLPPQPIITGLAPVAGSVSGGSAVSIGGVYLSGATAVMFGSTPAASFTVNSATSITAITPPEPPGSVEVSVTTPLGTSPTGGANPTGNADVFIFSVGPIVTSMSPSSGSPQGGGAVTISGAVFTGATAVYFGAVSVPFTVTSDNQITTTAPPGAIGSAVNVTISSPKGLSLVTPANHYSYTVPFGYWEVGSDGGVFTFGHAAYYGSMGGKHLKAPVVGIVSTPDGQGYWEFAADGGIFDFGDAGYYGSMGSQVLNAPVVAMAATPDGKGYWEAASDGGIFDFGDAGYYGSMGGKHLNAPIVSISSTADGKGYWLVAGDGGVFPFGDAGYLGSMGGQHLNKPVVAVASTPGPLQAGPLVTPATRTRVAVPAAPTEHPYGGSCNMKVPTITMVSPNAGPLGGGGYVTITGTDLYCITGVNFDEPALTGVAPATNPSPNVITFLSDTKVVAEVPPAPGGAAGTVDVQVASLGDWSAATPADQFQYTVGPTVSAVNVCTTPAICTSPPVGNLGGGDLIQVTGSGFEGTVGSVSISAPSVLVGGGANTCTAVTVVSPTELTCTTPSGTGTVDTTVTTNFGTSPTSPADQFTFASPPTVTNVSPDYGPIGGGTQVTISGTYLGIVSSVDFGGTPAGWNLNPDGTITAVAPSGTAGTTDITVTGDVAGNSHTSATTPADEFNYTPTPQVTGLTAASGPTAGGTFVTIQGNDLGNVSGVSFGGVPAVAFGPFNSHSVIAVSPPGTPGTVDITVTTTIGSSPTATADQFTYVPPLPLLPGYWEAGSDGGVFTFGGAVFHGSAGSLRLNAPIVDVAATPDGAGYIEVGKDGGVFTYGSAQYEGSMGGKPLAAPIVGIALPS